MLQAPAPHLSVNVVQVPGGLAGTMTTLDAMRAMVRTARTDPRIISAAVGITWLTPEKQSAHAARALYEYVRDGVRYVPDVHQTETLAYPVVTMERRVGDCDDQSTLLAALLESIGVPTRFILAGYAGNREFEHVYLQCLIDDQWIDCDPTEREFFGWAPPLPSVVYIEPVA